MTGIKGVMALQKHQGMFYRIVGSTKSISHFVSLWVARERNKNSFELEGTKNFTRVMIGEEYTVICTNVKGQRD